jgi:hypothetical protein
VKELEDFLGLGHKLFVGWHRHLYERGILVLT